MKNGWQTKKLGDVCSFENGDRGTNYPSRSAQTSHGIPFINAGHLTDKGIDIENLNFIPRQRFDLLSNGKIRKGDILFCLRGSLGKFASVESLSEGAIASSLVIVRPGESVLGRYILAYFQSDLCADMIAQFKNGAAQPNLSAHSLSKFAIPVPPMAEQQRIVGILDGAFAAITTAKANAEKNLQNTSALFESHLQFVLARRGKGWVKRKLGDVCSIARGGSPRPIQKFLTTAADGINWIKIGDATASGKYIYVTEQKIIPDGAKRSRIVHEGDFLLSNSMSFGRPYIMRTSGCIHDGWLVLSDYASHLDQDYLYLVLGSDVVFQQFNRLAAGSTVRNLNIELASRVEIPIPPLKQQHEIAKQLDAISAKTQRLEKVYEQKLVALDSLTKSLLNQAFTGKL